MGRLVNQWIASLSCTLSVSVAGTAFVWMAPLMVKFVSDGSPIPMTKTDSSWLSSSIEFGQVIGIIPATILADRVGRKPVILSAGPLSLLAWILVASTRSIAVLFVVRLIQGVLSAIAFSTVPMYLAEIAEPGIRGAIGCQVKVLWYFGTLFAYCTGPFVQYDYYPLVCAIVPIIFTIVYSFVPESPYFYLMVKNERRAADTLKWLRGKSSIENEIKIMKNLVDEEMRNKGSWRDLFATRKDRYVFFVVQLVCIIKMMNGLPVILMYATQTFNEEFANIVSSHVMTIIFGVVLLSTSFFATLVADRVGRRPLLIFSCAGSALCNLFTAVIYYMDNSTGVDMTSVKWLAYTSIIGFCIITNVGLGPLMTTIQAEYFPSHTRAVGAGFTEVVAAAAGFISIKQYQFVNDYFGLHINFFIFFLVSFFGTILLVKIVPETAGKTLGQIQESFASKCKKNERVLDT